MNTEGMDFIPVSPSKYDLTHGGWYSLSYAYPEVIKKVDADLVVYSEKYSDRIFVISVKIKIVLDAC